MISDTVVPEGVLQKYNPARKSHHPLEFKIATIRSNYKDAEYFSSNDENMQHSYNNGQILRQQREQKSKQ